MREPLRMSQSPVETFQHIIGAKYEIGHIHEGKRFSLTLTNSSLPQGGTAQCPRSPSQTVICPAGRKWECMSEHPVSPAVWEAAQKAHFSLSPCPGSWTVSCTTEGQWASGLEMESIKGTQMLQTTLGTPLGGSPTSHWACLTCRSPGWPIGTSSTLRFSCKHTSTPWPTRWAWS